MGNKVGNQSKSNLLVVLQFFLIGLLLFTTSKYRISIGSIFLVLSSILLVIWAMISMRKSRLRISPIPALDAVLIINGPYKYIRHPMYTAVLLSSLGLLLIHFTWMRLSMVIALTIVLLIKLLWEEKMLATKFSGYEDYMLHTKKIIPFLF